MASVNFLLRSSKVNDPFTARLQFNNPLKVSEKNPFGLDFVESKTDIYVFSPKDINENPLLNGKKFWTKYKKYKGNDLNTKTIILNCQNKQKNLREYILKKLGIEKIDQPSKEWLTSVIKFYYDEIKKHKELEELSNTPTEIIWHFDNYIRLKRRRLAPSTVLKLENEKKKFELFQEYQSSIKGYSVNYSVSEVNPDLQEEMEEYFSTVQKYSINTIAKTIKVLKTICNYSKTYGIVLSPRFDLVGMAYVEKNIIYLSFSELQTIKNTDVPVELQGAKDWLYLSAFLGSRISDFMRFNKNMISNVEGSYIIEFTQVKTKKKMEFILHPTVIEYLQNNDMNFPDPIEEQKYNDQIKKVCKLAGISQKVEGTDLTEISEGVWRDVKGIYPKYKLIGSHIGRISFCTNFYNRIETSLIRSVSGHSDERTLKSYIGKTNATQNKLIKYSYDNIDYTKD